MVAVVQLVRASDCGSECRRFESDQPPTKKKQKCFFFFYLVQHIQKQQGEQNCSPCCFMAFLFIIQPLLHGGYHDALVPVPLPVSPAVRLPTLGQS